MTSYQYLPSVTTTNTSGTSNVAPAPTAANVYQQALAGAMGIAATPYQPYEGQQIAGFTPDALAGFQGVRNMQGVQNPYLTQAGNLYETETNTWQNPYLPTSQNYYNQSLALTDPNRFTSQNLQRYMNPYQQSVVDATLAQMKQNQNEMFGKNTARSVMQGTFGGSGQALGRAEMARQLALGNAQTLAQLNASNYNQAMGQYNQQQQQAIGAYQDAAKTLGQLGQSQQQLGVTALQDAARGVGALGSQAQQAALADAQALMATGQQQQALQQAQLDRAYQQWQQARAYPYQQASFLSGIAQGLAPNLGSTTSSTGSSTEVGIKPYQNQSQNVMGQILGGVTSLAGLAMPKKDGGSVGYAGGGTPYEKHMSSTPYEEKGFGNLIEQKPYDAPDDYISDAMKLMNVIPSAKDVYAQQAHSALDQLMGRTKSHMGGGDDEGGSGGESDSGIGDAISSLGKLGKSVYSKYGSDIKDSFGSMFSADGGRIERYDGGSTNPRPERDTSKEKANAQYLLGLYKDILGRNAEQGGFDFWSKQPALGWTPETMASYFANSPERKRQVREAYVDIFGRSPDAGGLQYWTDRAGQGMSFADLQDALKNSPERQEQVAAEANQPPKTAIQKGWAALDPSSGVNKAIAREQMIDPSAKPVSNYDILRQQARARNPGPQLTPEQQGMPSMPDPNYYLTQLPTYNYYTQQDQPDWAGGTGANAAVTGSTGTPDANTSFLTSLYNRAFMRKPDEGGLAFWQKKMAEGMTPEKVRAYFDASAEHLNTAPVQGYFQKVASNEVNPETGLFNMEYTKPYYGRPTPANFNAGGSVNRARGGSVMSKEDIARAALQAGATPQEAAILTAIAMPESSGNPYAHNPNARTGDNSYGLWQINMLGRMGPERMRKFGLSSYNDLFDPVTNAKAALQLLRGKGGLRNWTTYTSGKFKPYYSTAANIVNNLVKDPDAVKAPISIPERSYADSRPRRGFFSRLLSEFSPISTAQAGESALTRINPKDPSGPLLPADEDVFKRGSAEQRIMGHRGPKPTKEGLGLTTQPQGYDTFKRSPEWFSSGMGASPTRSMFGETPERVSSADFPMSAEPMGTGFDEKVVAETPEEGAASTQESQRPSGRKYWGDYRDVEGSSFGDFIDELAGDVRTSEKAGTRETPMGKYQGQGGLGALFDLEGSNPYASQKQAKEEENFDLGNLFGIFG